MADALAVRGGLNNSGEVAGVAELVDALVLGTSGESRGVQVPPPAPAPAENCR